MMAFSKCVIWGTSLTYYPLLSCYMPSVCVWLAVFNHFLHSLQFWQVSAQRFHCLKSSLMASNQYFFGWPQVLFPTTSKSKICPIYSSVHFTCTKQCSLLHLNTESGLFSFNQLRRKFLLTCCSFLMLHNQNSIALSLPSKCFLCSCLRAQHFDE